MTTRAICLKGRRGEFGPSLDLAPARDVVYVGRAQFQGGWRLAASPYANPFRVQRVGGAAEAVRLYAEWLPQQAELMRRLPELYGKRLGCWCPDEFPCHARGLAALTERLCAAGAVRIGGGL